jgi:hypothetical protein
VNGHWDAGRADVERSLHQKVWKGRHHHKSGIDAFDLTGDFA